MTGSPGVGRGQALAALLVLLLALSGLTGFARGTTVREPGLLSGGPDDPPFTVGDLARLRAQPPPPAITARSAIVWDATAGTELYSKAPDLHIPPASTAKILTASLALDLLRLDTRVTIDQRDVSKPEDNESSMDLRAGEVVTVEDLLYGMLLVSGSDAARTVARVAGLSLLAGAPGDPVARFVQEMNARVTQLGLPNCHLVNPHGDDAAGQYCSARDLLRLADDALKRPTFAQIVALPSATRQTVDGRRTFALKNTNELLVQRPGVHGVKTGTTDGGGQCLVIAQWTPGGRIIAVVLGATDRYTDMLTLLDWTNAAYRWTTLGQGSDLPGLQVALARWGVAFHDRRAVVLQAWEVPSLRYRLLLEAGTGVAEEPRGKVVFLTGTREVLTLPVYAVP